MGCCGVRISIRRVFIMIKRRRGRRRRRKRIPSAPAPAPATAYVPAVTPATPSSAPAPTPTVPSPASAPASDSAPALVAPPPASSTASPAPAPGMASASAPIVPSPALIDPSLTLPAGEFEVFLSFRGPDTRGQITDTIYHFLINSKIRTFRDDDELRKGEEIWPDLVRAIGQSKIYLPIFSKGYADSKWCLKELAEMVERRKQDKRHIILPIFYMVDPRDVRHQTGPYQKAFREHEEKFDMATIQSWRDALIEAGNCSGWHVNSSDGQGTIADEVLTVLWSHISKDNYALEIDELVEIDNHVEAVVEKLSLDSENLTMVGIHGIGGIGKTTTAKAVYNKISSCFDRCCFVENIRETLKQKDGILTLQKKLVSEIHRGKDAIDLTSDTAGKKRIRDTISQWKILVVLDDVDENFKFEDVLGDPKFFVPGSRFIVTSRDVKVLRILNGNQCKLYEVGGMSHQSSLELFCKHAFKMNSPPRDYETLANNIVSTTGGLPLTLKVIGSALFREGIDIWEEKLKQLKRTPESQVMKQLQISYDTLMYEAQQIFLDIACFFIGESKIVASYMWSDCNLFPTININILVQRSMLKIGDNNEFRMHDQLRDMGREIVRQENIERPWMRSRIWSAEEAIYIMSNKKGSNRVKATRVDASTSSPVVMEELKSKCLSKLPELRYLDVSSTTLTGEFRGLLPNLRWLRLHRQDKKKSRHLTNLNMKNMVIFELHESFVEDDWGGWSQLKVMFVTLKE